MVRSTKRGISRRSNSSPSRRLSSRWTKRGSPPIALREISLLQMLSQSIYIIRQAEPHILQNAFQYSIVVPQEETSDVGSKSITGPKFCLKRQLRIQTMQYGTTGNINQLCDSVDSETMLSILFTRLFKLPWSKE